MPLFLPLPCLLSLFGERRLRDLPYVEASCNLNEDCQAWTYDGYRAFLKTAKGPMTYREGCFELIFHAKLID
eukprot:scaffold104773_cov17-Tisochrysis_lutea.AAC.2